MNNLRHPSNDLSIVLASSASVDEFVSAMSGRMVLFIAEAKRRIKAYRAGTHETVLAAEGIDRHEYEARGGKEGTIRLLAAIVAASDDPYRDEDFLRAVWNAR